jgi:hypothetical protein
MKKAWVIAPLVAVATLLTVGLFIRSKVKRYYKEKGLGVHSFVMKAQGPISAPPLELAKLIATPSLDGRIDRRAVRAYKKRLESLPMIKQSSVSKKRSTLIFSYTMREPFFKLADYDNVGIDEEGALFPLYPYYVPRKYVSLVLGDGLPADPFGSVIKEGRFEEAKRLYQALKTDETDALELTLMDLSQVDAVSMGRRSVVAEYKSETGSIAVTFFPLEEALVLKKVRALNKAGFGEEESIFVDLRIPEKALITRR